MIIAGYSTLRLFTIFQYDRRKIESRKPDNHTGGQIETIRMGIFAYGTLKHGELFMIILFVI